MTSEQGQAREHMGIAVASSMHEVVEHFPRWRLEKRDNAIEDYVHDRFPLAIDFVEGRRLRASDLPRERFERHLSIITDARALDGRSTATEALVIDALRALYHEEVPLDSLVEWEGNLLTTVGINVLMTLLTGGGGTVFSNANARLGVGDSATAAAVGQTNLQAATNKLFKAMNATYPLIASPDVNFQSTFGSAEANFVWNEVVTANGAAPPTDIILNRVVQALGTKTAGATWTLTETITWS